MGSGGRGTRHQTSPVSTICLPLQVSFWISSSTLGSRTEVPDCCSQVRPMTPGQVLVPSFLVGPSLLALTGW